MPDETYGRIIRVAKREEREHILGIIEFLRDEMGDSPYENYTKKKLTEVVSILEKE